MEADSPFVEGMRRLLGELGLPPEEIDRAADDSPAHLILLYADRAIIPGVRRLTRIEVADEAGIELAEAIAFWRALGFPDVPDDEKAFTEFDVDVLRSVVGVVHTGIVDRDLALQTTRVMGRSLAQIAAALVETIRSQAGGGDDELPAPELLAATPALLTNIERWLGYVFRRHVVAEAKRAAVLAETTDAGTAVVGFADLVGFTGISQSLDEATLAAAVTKFESTAVELVGAHGGRVIKMIGDEVMFEAPGPREGALIALDLVDAFSDDDQLPDVRAGVALGSAVRHQGDLYGEAPNLASRLVEEAYPGSVLVSGSIHDALEEDTDVAFKSVRPHFVKGFGRMRFWSLRRPGDESRRPWKIPLLDLEL